jgi:hypothetical protein
MKPLQRAESLPPKWTSWCATMMQRTGLTPEELRRIYEEEFLAGETWMNDLYVVIAKSLPHGATHLSIRRVDRKPCRDWRHFQEIKNQLCGKEREGLELYPAESRLVDTANQYHLWVMPEGVKLEIGWAHRSVLGPEECVIPGAVQRPFEEAG